MKKRRFACMVAVALVLCLMLLTGCEVLDGLRGEDDGGNTVIKIKSVEIVEDRAVITYEDGYLLELNDVSKAPLLYYREEKISLELIVGGVTTGRADTVGESDAVETLPETQEEQTPNAEETKQAEQTEPARLGVRVQGTKSNPLAVNVVTQGSIGGDKSFSAVQGTDGSYVIQGDGVSFVQGDGIFSSVASTSFTYVEIDGKLYEEYYTRLKGHLAANCKELTVEETVDGELVEVVMDGGFSELTALEKVTLPASIVKIGKAAFYQCTSLTDITFLGTVEQWNAIEKGSNWDKDSGGYTVHCIDGDIAKEITEDVGEKK